MGRHSGDLTDFASRPEYALKPVIKELVRTQVCFANLKLLVDKVTVVILRGDENATGGEAYRLFLTDGEKTIQGSFPMGSVGMYERKLTGTDPSAAETQNP